MSGLLPEGLRAYKRAPVFDADSLPTGLRREHRTRTGVWALIHILEGRLLYRTLDPESEEALAPGLPGVVKPGQPHEVEPIGKMRMFVEFYAGDVPTSANP